METSTIINNYPLSPEAIEALVADARHSNQAVHESFPVHYAQQETPSEINNHVLAHFQSDKRKREQQRDLDEIRHYLSIPPTQRLSLMVESWAEFLEDHGDDEDASLIKFLEDIALLLYADDGETALLLAYHGAELLDGNLPDDLDIEHSRFWSDVEKS